MISLSDKWVMGLVRKPETGMGYQVISVVLKDGSRFDQAVVIEGQITEIRGYDDVPFCEDQIAEIILTHEKWNFNADRK